MFVKIENNKITSTVNEKELRDKAQSRGVFLPKGFDGFDGYKKVERPAHIIPQGKTATEEIKLVKGVPTTTYTYADIEFTADQIAEHIRAYARKIEHGGIFINEVFIDTTDGSQLKMAGGVLREMLRADPDAAVKYYVSKSPDVLEITSKQFIGMAQAIGDHVAKVLAAKTAVQKMEIKTLTEVETAFDIEMAK